MTLQIYHVGKLVLSINGFNTIDEAIAFARDRVSFEQLGMSAEVWDGAFLTAVHSWDLIPVSA